MGWMIVYRSIETSIWSDPEFKHLDSKGKLLFFFLITNDLAHLSGVYCIEPEIMAYRTGISVDDIDRVLDTLSIGNLAFFDKAKEVVFVRNMFRYQAHGEKAHKAAAKQLKTVHASHLIHDFLNTYPVVLQYVDKSVSDRVSDTLSDRTSNQKQKQKQKQNQKRSKYIGGSAPKKKWETDEDFVRLKSKFPIRSGNNPWQAAYSAYRARLKEGATVQEIEDGIDRYAKFCHATDKLNTEFTMRMSSFLGSNRCFKQPFDIPRAGAAISHANDDAIARAMGASL